MKRNNLHSDVFFAIMGIAIGLIAALWISLDTANKHELLITSICGDNSLGSIDSKGLVTCCEQKTINNIGAAVLNGSFNKNEYRPNCEQIRFVREVEHDKKTR